METQSYKELSEAHKEQILQLWNKEYPLRMAYKDMSGLEAYLKSLSEPWHLLMLDNAGAIKAWYFDFIRNDERWFALIVDSTLQGKGLGTRLLSLAREQRAALCGWVIDHEDELKSDGKPYRSPLPFYIKNGFEVLPKVRLELDKISAVKIHWTKQHRTDEA